MDNREKILNCALELFHARGYDAVGVQEIAETAGVTKPTLYYYFRNKRGLWRRSFPGNMHSFAARFLTAGMRRSRSG